ncbi:MAG: SagB family peptide dehydrogenase [Caldisphaera sp.]
MDFTEDFYLNSRINNSHIGLFEFSSIDRLFQISPKLSSELWPTSWVRIQYKSYPRSSKIVLPKPKSKLIKKSLAKVILNRHSLINSKDKNINLETLSALLGFSCGVIKIGREPNLFRRTYPSAGRRYPLEVYLIIKIDGGRNIFHYNVLEHKLEMLNSISDKELLNALTEKEQINSPLLIVITGVFLRSYVKYGDNAYRLILIEAGHLGQNLSLVGEALNLDVCPLRGFIEGKLNKIIKVDGYFESSLYMFSFGARK